MKHTWLVGILAGVLLAGSAVGAGAAEAGGGADRRSRARHGHDSTRRDGGRQAARRAGRYTVRLTAQSAQPTVAGQLPDLNRWVEFVQGGQVKGREVVSIIPADEVQQTQQGPDLDAGQCVALDGSKVRDAEGRRLPARLDCPRRNPVPDSPAASGGLSRHVRGRQPSAENSRTHRSTAFVRSCLVLRSS